MKLKEIWNTIKIVFYARRCEDFLWGNLNEGWGFEEWKRILTKRVHKIVKIDLKNPHWKIELKKRLLQNACVSIGLLNEVDNLVEGIHPTAESNLPEIEPILRRCEAKP